MIVAPVAAAGILLAVIVLHPGGTRSLIRPGDTGPVHDQTNSLDLTRAQFQIGIVEGIGEKLHLVDSINNLTEQDVASARLTQPDGTSVLISFSPTGAAKMKALTSANVGKELGFVRNGDVVFHTVIDRPFSSDGQISFSSTSEVKEFFMKLQDQASMASQANVAVTEFTPAPTSSGGVPANPAIVPRLTGRATGRGGLGSAQTPPATVPDLSGRTEQEARDLLAKARLRVGAITQVEANIKPGTVLGQDRTPGSVVTTGTPVGFTLAIRQP